MSSYDAQRWNRLFYMDRLTLEPLQSLVLVDIWNNKRKTKFSESVYEKNKTCCRNQTMSTCAGNCYRFNNKNKSRPSARRRVAENLNSWRHMEWVRSGPPWKQCKDRWRQSIDAIFLVLLTLHSLEVNNNQRGTNSFEIHDSKSSC